MPRLLYFYPENDVALASGQRQFTPPAAALALRRSCGMIMRWMGSDGDFAAYSTVDEEFENTIADTFGLPCGRWDATLNTPAVSQLAPWGWSAASANELAHLGAPTALIPDGAAIERLRNLSHRRTSIAINRHLADAGIYVSPEAIELTDIADLKMVAERFSDHFFVKTPWSSSGRGVIDSRMVAPSELQRRINGSIRRQGSVVIEKALSKIIDFAMLFEATDDGVEYLGLSMFYTNAAGAYAGNVVAHPIRLQQMLAEYVEPEEQQRLAAALTSALTDVLHDSGYKGPLGVDMMVYDADGQRRVAPCIELNLRWTMGVVAHILAERYLAEGSEGIIHIEPSATSKNTVDDASNGSINNVANTVRSATHAIEKSNNALIDSKRLVEGRVNLVAPNDSFNFYFQASRSPLHV